MVSALLDLRDAEPELFSRTAPPPATSRPVPDFAPMDELLLVYPGWSDHDPTYATLLRHASHHGRVRVLLLAGDLDALGRVLDSTDADQSRIRIDLHPLVDNIWVRDWGPQPLAGPAGDAWVDWLYSPDCYDSDAVPTKLGEQRAVVQVVRSDLYVDGGNLVTDETGRCYTTTSLADSNALSAKELGVRLRREARCTDVVVLEPLAGNVIDHVDMLLAPAPGGVLLLASFDPVEDPENAAVMARNRVLLQTRPRFDGSLPVLVDVLSPAPGWSLEGPLVRTWVNLLPFNGVVFVPAYADAQPSRQAEALRTVEDAFPEREAVLVPSDPLILHDGGVHCLGRAWPGGG